MSSKAITMDDVLNSSFGEASSEITSSFKKTVFIRQYETEAVEYSSTIKLEKPVSGAERVLLSAILQAQLEYSAYCDLAYKGLVTSTEFNTRRDSIVEDLNKLKEKAESVLGKSLDNYFGVTF